MGAECYRPKASGLAGTRLEPGPGTASRLRQYGELSLCGRASAATRASRLSMGPERASEKVAQESLSLRPLMGRELSDSAGANLARMLTGALHQDWSASECFSPTAARVTRFTPSTLQGCQPTVRQCC